MEPTEASDVRAQHTPESRGLYCDLCFQRWPCEASLCADALERAVAERNEWRQKYLAEYSQNTNLDIRVGSLEQSMAQVDAENARLREQVAMLREVLLGTTTINRFGCLRGSFAPVGGCGSCSMCKAAAALAATAPKEGEG